MSPIPAPDENEAIYGREYYSSPTETGLSYLEEKRHLLPCYTSIVQRFLLLGIRERLLDVGCATGEFLVAARELGISGEGVEPSAYAAAQAREKGLFITHGVLSDVLKNTKRYAAAHCSHVLEHVPDMHEFMGQMRGALEINAPIYIEVPLQFEGVLDWLNRIRGQERAYSVFSIHHHYFFTPKSLMRLLHAHGFEVRSLTTFLSCRRQTRSPGLRKWLLQLLLSGLLSESLS